MPTNRADVPLRVLCLDIEGGHGGSSRSLFELLRYIDQNEVALEVVCRRDSMLLERYRELGIPCRVVPKLPKVSSVSKDSRNIIVYARFLLDFCKGFADLRLLRRDINAKFDLVHFNHEGFFLMAAWLRRYTKVPFVLHVRTNIRDTWFAKWQVRIESLIMNHFVFITSFERETFENLGGQGEGTVIHNVAKPLDAGVSPHPAIVDDERFKIVCLANYSWDKGLDRLIDVAVELAARGRQDIAFVMAGEMKLTRSMPGDLGHIGATGGTLADYAAKRGVADWFVFLGHVDEPERVLVAGDLLAKPTREDNVWGRDVIEAMAAGKPIIAVGAREVFVTNGESGFLAAEFDPVQWADTLVALADDPERRQAMGEAARRRVAELCDGPARAADLAAVWRSVHAKSPIGRMDTQQ